ncbi:MAG: DUF6262 family protein [Legionellaceae bacterium]|nr:DUF6262 family protein [Legionellaceae bacterium]
MTHERNTSGLTRAAQDRRKLTIKRVEAAIKLLINDRKPINFNTVSKTANVGKPWLYKEDAIRKQIEDLREKNGLLDHFTCDNSSKKASQKSKDNIVQMLKERVSKLDAENHKLKEQIEALYGELFNKK